MTANLDDVTDAPEAPSEPTADRDLGPASAAARRQRFRAAVSQLAAHSTSQDLVRWMLIPASVAVVLGFGVMVLGWVGAARTAREIEQIPYLISGGLIGLGLVVLGGLLLASAFWVAVLRKLHEETETGTHAQLEALRARVVELEARPTTPPGRSSRGTAGRRVSGSAAPANGGVGARAGRSGST